MDQHLIQHIPNFIMEDEQQHGHSVFAYKSANSPNDQETSIIPLLSTLLCMSSQMLAHDLDL